MTPFAGFGKGNNEVALEAHTPEYMRLQRENLHRDLRIQASCINGYLVVEP